MTFIFQGTPFSVGILTCLGLVDGRVAVLGDRLSGLVVCLCPPCNEGISILGDGYVVQSPLPFVNILNSSLIFSTLLSLHNEAHPDVNRRTRPFCHVKL
jgi:hypothetical protein